MYTVQDKTTLLREIYRGVMPGSPLGLLVIVAWGLRVFPAPDGNLSPPSASSWNCSPIRNSNRSTGTTARRCHGRGAPSRSLRSSPAGTGFALAVRQSENFTRLFASGQISMQLIHAVKRPARQATTQATRGGKMSKSIGDDDFEIELEVEIEAEISMSESSRPEEAADRPISEWLFDPADVQREDVERRNLLSAVEELEGDHRPRRRGA
jgi:hypothetical protein